MTDHTTGVGVRMCGLLFLKPSQRHSRSQSIRVSLGYWGSGDENEPTSMEGAGNEIEQAPSTLMRFRLKTHTFRCVFPYRPHYKAERFHQKRIPLETLSRVETFENGAGKRKRISVDGENGGFCKR